MSGEIRTKKHEFIGVLLLLVAVLLLVCLTTYNPRDSSFNALSYKVNSENKVGRIGAHVSDLLFQAFGLSAFFMLFPLVILSWKLILGRQIHAPYLRTLGFLLLIASASMALQLFPVKLPDVNFTPGGVTGALLADLLLPNLNRTGTIIVLVGALLLGLLASTSLSLGNIFSRVAPKLDTPRPGIWERFRKWRENRRPIRTVVNIKPAAPDRMFLV